MVAGPAAADAVQRARRLPNLRVGLHVVVVDGDAAADLAAIPGLLDRDGRLRNDVARFGTEISVRPSLQRQVATEITAQFEAYRTSGLPLDHVNAHRHFHLHPTVAAAILRIGQSYGMRALRTPVEPWRTITAIDPKTRRHLSWIVAPWAARLRRCARHAGLTAPDAVFGLAWSGAMTARRLSALLAQLPDGFR